MSDLTKITFNIYTMDYEALIAIYGRGWSRELRELVHNHLAKQRRARRDDTE